ncbi:MAG TPA: hypothetical protein VNR60_08705 [Croceibacterium sp.]|nr:hypothetical protein [Croceibacterium sp.]
MSRPHSARALVAQATLARAIAPLIAIFDTLDGRLRQSRSFLMRLCLPRILLFLLTSSHPAESGASQIQTSASMGNNNIPASATAILLRGFEMCDITA